MVVITLGFAMQSGYRGKHFYGMHMYSMGRREQTDQQYTQTAV